MFGDIDGRRLVDGWSTVGRRLVDGWSTVGQRLASATASIIYLSVVKWIQSDNTEICVDNIWSLLINLRGEKVRGDGNTKDQLYNADYRERRSHEAGEYHTQDTSSMEAAMVKQE